MNFETIYHTVVNEGVAVSIVIVLIYMGVTWFNYYIYDMKNRTKRNKHDELLDRRVEVNQLIEDELERLVDRTGASRAYLIEYHNGGEGLGRLPFLKMTNTVEKCNEGVDSYQSSMKDIPCSNFATFITKVDKDPYVVLDTEARDLTLSDTIYRTMVMQGMGKSIFTKVKGRNRTIGIVGLDYNTGNNKLDELNVETLQDLAIKIGAWLTVK